jgi:hypothetical protein
VDEEVGPVDEVLVDLKRVEEGKGKEQDDEDWVKGKEKR